MFRTPAPARWGARLETLPLKRFRFVPFAAVGRTASGLAGGTFLRNFARGFAGTIGRLSSPLASDVHVHTNATRQRSVGSRARTDPPGPWRGAAAPLLACCPS